MCFLTCEELSTERSLARRRRGGSKRSISILPICVCCGEV